jgi:hypothetical protein
MLVSSVPRAPACPYRAPLHWGTFPKSVPLPLPREGQGHDWAGCEYINGIALATRGLDPMMNGEPSDPKQRCYFCDQEFDSIEEYESHLIFRGRKVVCLRKRKLLSSSTPDLEPDHSLTSRNRRCGTVARESCHPRHGGLSFGPFGGLIL